MKKCFYLLTLLALLLQPGVSMLRSASAQEGVAEPQAPADVTLYVKPLATGAGNCSSWANACGLQTALGAAVSGDEIWVQAGTYKPDFWENLTDFTFSAWVYWTSSTTSWQRIFDFGRDESNYIMLTPYDDLGRMRFEIRSNGTAQYVNNGTFPGTESTHLVVTLSGNTLTIYLNGVQYDQSTNIQFEPKDVIGDNVWLGRSQFSVDPYFNGAIDEVALFNRALSPAEVLAVYNNGWDATPGKVLALHLEENPASNGTVLMDSNENGYGGRLYTNNGTANKSTGGQIGQAISLDGNGDFITLRTRRQGTFNLKNGVALYGGFAGTETSREQRNWEMNITTLSGDIGAAGTGDNSYHVVTGSGVDGSAVLDGFTITAGNANGGDPYHRGSGMNNDGGSPTIANVIFSGNAAVRGGGMFNFFSSPTLANVTFNGNTATEYGGGMFNFYGNPTLIGVTFSGNTAVYSGGGMYDEESSPELANVTFSGNTAVHSGGGMRNYNSSPELANVTFSGNAATNSGGGMSNYGGSPELANVTFSGNEANYGGGMYNYGGSPELANVTFSGNTATNSGGGMCNDGSSPTLANAILWGNTPDQISNDDSTPVITYSDVEGGCPAGATCTQVIASAPQFVRNPSPGGDGNWGTPDDDYGDLRLQLASPAIDAGDNAAVPTGVLTDLLGIPRFIDIPAVPNTGNGAPPIVDMGAYEACFLTQLPFVIK